MAMLGSAADTTGSCRCWVAGAAAGRDLGARFWRPATGADACIDLLASRASGSRRAFCAITGVDLAGAG